MKNKTIKFLSTLIAVTTLSGCIPGTPKYKAMNITAYDTSELSQVSNAELCVTHYYYPDDADVISEIRQRNLITERHWQLVRGNKIAIGMSICAVRALIGPETKTNTRTSKHGTRIQMVYRIHHASDRYVYLENGAVTSWTNL